MPYDRAMPAAAPSQTLKTLLTGLFDYAGLFPPASLPMEKAVDEYNRRLLGEQAYAMGRFVCPASGLEELTRHGRVLMPGTFATSGYREMAGMVEPWQVSAVSDVPLEEALDAIGAFDARHATEDGGLAAVKSIELKMPDPGFVDEAMEAIPEDLHPFFEIPQERLLAGEDIRGYVAALATNEGAACKIRCGGVRPEMIPPAGAIADAIVACAASNVPLKCTAGLHHPVRAEQPLTYAADPPRAVMHGFLNVFVAMAFAKEARADRGTVVEILEETDPAAFVFTERAVAWRGREMDLVSFARSRERFALGVGTCSFAEPMDDLRGLGLL